MQMRVSAQMHLDAPGAKVTPTPGAVLDRSSSLPVEQWAKDPEVGGEALRSLVEQLRKGHRQCAAEAAAQLATVETTLGMVGIGSLEADHRSHTIGIE